MTDEQPQLPAPPEFDWLTYADATFAGLSILIPIPLLDMAFEWYFRQRIGPVIARRNGRPLHSAVIQQLNKGEGCAEGCATLPFKLIFELFKRLSRKILYFLTVKEATDQLSYYWHRAFLLDYIIERGYLSDPAQSQTAVDALNAVLKQEHKGPLEQLAGSVVGNVSHIFKTLRRARGGEEDEVVQDARARMARRWGDFSGYFEELTAEYERVYQGGVDEWVVGSG
jgi:hypothetical protein